MLCWLFHRAHMQPQNMLSVSTSTRGKWKQEKRMGQILSKVLVKLALPVSPAPAWDTSLKAGLFPHLGTTPNTPIQPHLIWPNQALSSQ